MSPGPSKQQTHRKLGTEPSLTPAKRRIFTAFTIASPVLMLIALELSLRASHYGPNLALFTTEVVNGSAYSIMNPSVRDRYFTQVGFSPSTSPDYFLVPKPAGTYRIFCLGGSTTVGYPYWYNGSFSTFLRDRLRRIFPEKPIEVINVGMTATNSFTVVDMARDLVDFEPDLMVVYDGHNEFYGALGISSNQSPGKSRWISHAYLKLLRFRTFLLVRDLYARAVSLFREQPAALSRGTMMEKLAYGNYIPYGSETYWGALSMFEGNLRDLRDICTSHKIPLILSTQVSNMRDQPPFISGMAPGKTPEERMHFNNEMNRGLTHFMNGMIDSALVTFRSVLAMDSLRPETHYLIASCLDSLHDRGAAAQEYRKAKDYDQLRFRTSSDFNASILLKSDDTGVFVVDMERVFQENSRDSLIGRTLITEHLHPNSSGYFLMGKAFAELMRAHGLLAPVDTWAKRDTIPDAFLWRERNLTTVDELIARRRTEILTSGWPFTQQVPTVNAVAMSDTLGQIVERVTRGLSDWKRAHEEAAAYYERRGELDSLEREEKVIMSQIPLDVDAYLNLAHVYLSRGKFNEMAAVLKASQNVRPTILAARALGDIALQSGKPLEAVAQYEKMSQFPQSAAEQVENGYLLALAYQRANMPEQASTQLLKILKLRPGYKPAVDLLARING